MRRLLLLLGALLLALPLGAAAGTAQAAPRSASGDGYRYWSFWEREGGSWSYATQGPSTLRPDDGDVLGFRFTFSKDAKDAARPRGEADFDAACADTGKKSGKKRVALRIDFGTGDEAPGGEKPPKARTACALIDGGGSAADALAAVAKPLRYNSDYLLCAVDGYPAKGCGDKASKESEGAEASKSSGTGKKADGEGEGDGGMSTGLGVVAGIAAVAVLGAAALWQARRRK